MKTALITAVNLIFSGDRQLLNILGVTMRMCIASSLIALIIGVPIGVLYALARFPGRKVLIVINRTLMGMPPVVCGLICYMLFSGVGPLRSLRLLYTVKGMVIAQVLLITPLIIGNMETFLQNTVPAIRETSKGLGLSGGKLFVITAAESRYQIISTFLLGFARATAEVGAVSMVGGAIAYKTNVMTTAIMNYTNMGDFTMGVALGMILLVLSLILNIAIFFLQKAVEK